MRGQDDSLRRKIFFPLKSYPRTYGRSGVFHKIVNDIQYIIFAYRDFNSWFIKQDLIRVVGAPRHLVGEALEYLISEKFISGPAPAPKNQMFSFRVKRHNGIVMWDPIDNRWAFEYTTYDCIHKRMHKLTGRCHTCKTSFSKSHKIRIWGKWTHQSHHRRVFLPNGLWDEMAYCANKESDSYCEFAKYVQDIQKNYICPKCQFEFKHDDAHSFEQCKLNMVNNIMTM
jgi:hypothetical protein